MKLNKIMTAGLLSCSLSTMFLGQQALAQQISGVVTQANGQVIVNAKISLENEQNQVFSDEQGRFILDGLTEGIVELHVSARNFSHYNQRIEISSQNIDDLVIGLLPSVIEIIDVFATPLHSSSIESALPVNVLTSDELRLKQASTLGETLKNEVGVHSSYYGPVSSSPIIRGLDGPRVLITQNGLDAGDASRVGPDHVVASETSTATQIEVLRGPATLFYGSGAIGGVVNVVDNRIPTSTDDTAEWLLQHNTVANENQASISLQTGKGNIALHLDGFLRESGDYKLAGEAELHHDEHGLENEDDHAQESTGKLANSASKSNGFTIGTSYLFDNGFAGLSYGLMNREYGVPGHQHEDEHFDVAIDENHQEEGVFADMKQQRLQFLSEFNFSEQFISVIKSKFAYTDYQHQEIENGEVGTQFNNNSTEARVDLYHQDFQGFSGAWTLHYKNSDFEAIGEEAFTPPSTTETLAVAWLEEKHFGDLLLQLGARIEHVSITANDSFLAATVSHDNEDNLSFEKQSFVPLSASAGLVWDFNPGYNLGLSVAYSQRAPSAAELFSYGPHIGTNTFEVGALYEIHDHGDGHFDVELGDQDVNLESSYNFDVTLRKFEGNFGFVISAFYNQIDDFYYQQDTGFTYTEHDHGGTADTLPEEDGLPVLVFRQDDVEMYGLEAELVYQVNEPLKATIFSDYIRAKLIDGDNLPRIPPMRVGLTLNYQAESFASELSFSHYFDQTDIAERETDTEGYSMLDANFNYYLEGFGSDTVLYIKGQNLTDVNARVHSSFLKNVAPLPGRGFSLGIRGSF